MGLFGRVRRPASRHPVAFASVDLLLASSPGRKALLGEHFNGFRADSPTSIADADADAVSQPGE